VMNTIAQATAPMVVDLGTAAMLAFFACRTDMDVLLNSTSKFRGHRSGWGPQLDVFGCAAG
jgi:hypothetical protein